MTRKNIAIFLLGILLMSCSRKDEGASSSARIGGNAPPRITSASVYPDRPKANTSLIAQYRGEDSEGDFVRYAFRWYVDNELVQEGPLGTLEPGKHRKGSEVYVEIIPSDAQGAGKPYKAEAVVVGNQPPAIASVKLEPADPPVGAVITAVPEGSDPDGDDITYQYQWFVNGKASQGPQEGNTLSTKGLRKKDKVFVVVTPSDRDDAGKLVDSAIVVLANSAPRVTSAPAYAVGDGIYSYQVTATDPDGDKLTYSLEKAPQGMVINPTTGLIRWEVPKEVSGRQEVPIKIVVDDGDGGKATQEFSLTIEMK